VRHSLDNDVTLDREQLAPRLVGTPFVLLLDVDGTLAPIAPRPSDAVVPPTARDAIVSLAHSDGVVVALVSGRAAEDARRLVGIDPVWVIGNHGAEIASPDGHVTVEPHVAIYEGAIAAARGALEQSIGAASMRGVIVEDKRWTLTVHYRGADPDPGLVPALADVVARVAAAHGLVMVAGKKVLELRPPVPVDKGTAVLALAERTGGLTDGASMLYAGDDATDEDAFLALRSRAPSAVTLHVDGEGSRDTAAEYIVSDPMEMGSLLAWLAELRRSRV
jgi:trehalose 6-phosphate phosphatase